MRVPAPTASLLADASRRRVIERLVNARLLRVDEGSLTVAHEAITRAWPRLADMARRRSGRRPDGGRCVDGRGDVERVWSARRRPVARRASAGGGGVARGVLARPHRRRAAFLDASDARHRDEVRAASEDAAERDRRQNRRLRWALGGAAVLVVTTVVLGGLAAVRAQEAAQAQADARFEALAATAQSTRESDRFGAALLAAALYRQRPNDARAASALLAVLSAPDTPTTPSHSGRPSGPSPPQVPGTTEVLAVTGPVGESAEPARAEVVGPDDGRARASARG